tara:strand:- start:18290 stop:19468 length:1179 start_codon:yes stop_codon:yes gene_type:complete
LDQAILFITFGALFMGGLAAEHIGRLTRLPRVTILLLFGILVGRSGLDLVPPEARAWFEPMTVVSLSMVAFLLGADLTRKKLAQHGRAILAISLAIVLGTTLIVWGGLLALGLDPGAALLLGAIATATAPPAVADVIRQLKIQNGFTETLTGIVAIDDVWGVMVFSLCLALVAPSGDWAGPATTVFHDIGGAVLLGLLIGAPSAYLTGRLKPGEPQMIEALGVVFLTAGLALWLEVSFLIAGMTAGAVIANFARHHDYAFNETERVELPFLLLFFLLAGATLDLRELVSVAGWAAAYVTLRILARIVSGWLGAYFGGVPAKERPLYGPALLPQAGVAVGMALVAAEVMPESEALIVPIIIASSVIFDVFGPAVTAFAVRRTERSAQQIRPPD